MPKSKEKGRYSDTRSSAREGANEEVRRIHRAPIMLSACNQTLVRAADELKFAADICRIAVDKGGYLMACAGLRKEGADAIFPVASAVADNELLGSVQDFWEVCARADGPVSRVIRTARIETLHFDSFHPFSEARGDSVSAERTATPEGAVGMILPVEIYGRPAGVLAIFAEARDAFDEGEQAILLEMAHDLGYGIETIRERIARKRSEENFRSTAEQLNAVVQSSPAAIFSMDKDHRILTWNQAATRIFGWSEEETVGRVLPMVPEEQWAAHEARMSRILDGELLFDFELDQLRKDGSRSWISVSAAPIRDKQGKVVGIMAAALDIGPRKQAEQEQALTVSFLKLVNDSRTTHELVERTVNFFKESLGFEAVGVRLQEGDNFPYYKTLGFPEAFILEGNSLRPYAETGKVERDADSNAAFECMCADVILGRFDPTEPYFTPSGSFWTGSTSRMLAEIGDAEGKTHTCRRCNTAGYESVGLFALRTGERCLGLLQLSDSRLDRLTASKLALCERLTAHFAVGLAKMRADEELARSEARYRELVANLEDIVFSADLDGRIQFMSPAVERIFGYAPEEILGRYFSELAHPDDIREVSKSFARILSGSTESSELRMFDKEDRLHYLRIHGRLRFEAGAAVGIDGILVDFTEHRKTEEQLRSAQRLEAVGRLAGGVAHDFNNMLAVIINYADFVLDELDPRSSVHSHVREISKAGERAAALTRQLLAFSRKQVLAPEVINLNKTIASVEKMLRRLLGEDVEFIIRAAERLKNTKADPGQIEQVIVNLALNARDAMPKGGRLIIETRNVRLDEKNGFSISVKEHVLLSVSDTGCGIDEETQKHIFDPFFSTKEKGKGTGLGLATVYGIIKQSNGNIEVRSEPGRGAVFNIYLPCVDAPATLSSTPASFAVMTGKETVLLVEDEDGVRNVAEHILRKAGYKVLSAENGEEALRLFANSTKRNIDLLLTDIVMPKMSGQELADRLLKARPTIKVLYMSGHTDDAIVQRGISKPGDCFLAKPFTAAGLAMKVRNLLDDNVAEEKCPAEAGET